MKLLQACCVATLLFAGCSKRQVHALGGVVIGDPVTVAGTKEIDSGTRVLLRGTMTKKCPVAGCWFMLTDETGTIKVDLKNSEFVVVDVPLKSKMVVAGYLATNETDRVLEATGLQF